MNEPRSGSSHGRKPLMLTWQAVASPRLESVRLVVSEGKLRAAGRIIAPADPDRQTEAFSASFEAAVDRAEEAGRLLLRTTTADEERQVSLNRTEDGIWLIDHGAGAQRNAFDGAIDVDVARAVTFTALPVRRLSLHRDPAEHELPVLYIALPDLSIRLVRQTYRTVSINDDGGGAVINYTDADLSTDITVDRDGMVVDYPGIASRV